MARRSGGLRSGARYKLRVKSRDKGAQNIAKRLQEFENNDIVMIKTIANRHQGMPHTHFLGKQGSVIGKKGRCYMVSVLDGSKAKTIISHPVHLQKVSKGVA
ncbi:MAG: 50S ribosomal protein L21e [Euryarchaeota archaeon HGW-Euryarchaeota-1]|nr:MAG: 50S ribosomal protein L21e [Euryarchaeota archaeon HGW-Euryarchaeota-1]